MNIEDLDKYKNMLIEEKKELINTIHKLEDNNEGSLKESIDELSVYDNHPADISTETFMQEQNINLKDREKVILTKIDLALDRIKEGNYGNCIVCGKEIEKERLDLIPYTITCIDDREKINMAIKNDRPIEEEFLGNTFGRINKDNSKENFVGTDGEDIYQKVADFNRVEEDPSNSTGDNQGVFDENEKGIVEDIDKVSKGYYKGQMQGENREDIPDDQQED